MPRTIAPEHVEFVEQWNAADPAVRRQVRRLVRVGRPAPDAEQAELAVGFGAYQRSRPWFRLFWLWFPVAVVIALLCAMALHPIVLGIVLGLAVNALLVRRNFRRVEKVNDEVLTGEVDEPAIAGAA